MAKTILKKLKTNNIKVNRKMRDYSNDPFFKQKAEEAIEFLKKYPPPKSLRK